FNAFVSPNYPVLADVGVYLKYNKHNILKPNFKKLKVHKVLDNRVVVLKLFPGISKEAVEAILHIPDLKVVILETFGSGNATMEEWFITALKTAVESGLHIINVSQCPAGAVEQGKYDTSLMLKEIGIISGYDITTEAALTKSMFLLGQNFTSGKFRVIMNLPLRGEISVQ
ncbi:L-asparaginase I, cytoplasmic, partial [hydrothermal vent metagenome]